MEAQKDRVEIVEIKSLVLDPANARKHSSKNLNAIKGSLTRFGQQKPIVVGYDNVVIAGNGTLAGAIELGWTTIEIRRSDLSGSDRMAFALADNRSGELAEWDLDILPMQLEALRAEDFDLEGIGFDVKDLDTFLPEGVEPGLTDPDEVPEQVETRCKTGDLWILGNHRLLCGDSTNVQHVERLMGGEKAELCFTSPPYADQREYNGGKELSTKHLATFIRAAYGSAKLFAVNLGISRKDGEIVQYWDDYIKEAKDCGLKLLSWNVWDRLYPCSLGQQTAMFPIEHEWILVLGATSSELNKTVPNKWAGHREAWGSSSNREIDGSMSGRRVEVTADSRRLGTVIRQDIHRGESPHPAMFPVALPEAYIEACTNPGDGVYEPFTGSGSTLIACEKTARRCYGMELDPKYCDVILARWEKFTGKEARRVGDDPQ